MRRVLLLCALSLAVLLTGSRQASATDPSWTRDFPPFRIAGNLYYVGSEELAAYLIATPQGLILINSNIASSPPQIKRNVEALGFHFSDIKILLISHGHFDHCAGSAEIKRMTGAKYFVMDRDVPVVESGGRNDFQYARDKSMWFPPTHVDRVLHDGDTVRLGGTILTAHLTAGHTQGTTTWTMDQNESGKTLHVVIVGGPNVLDSYRLVGHKSYPQITDDFRHQFEVLRALPCDVFLGAHASFFGLKEKYQRWKAGDKDAFVDPAGYRHYVADRQQAFEANLERQQRAAR